MKKIVLFIMIILIFIVAVFYSPYVKDFFEAIDEKKVYKIENIKTTEINTLEEFKFFDSGIISYNNNNNLSPCQRCWNIIDSLTILTIRTSDMLNTFVINSSDTTKPSEDQIMNRLIINIFI